MGISGFCRLILLLIIVLALAGVLILPIGVHGRQWGPLFDLAHAPVFFAVFFVFVAVIDPAAAGLSNTRQRFCRLSPVRLIIAAAGLCGIGIGCELAQQLYDRQPSLDDVAANCAGLLAGFIWCASRRVMPRGRRMLFASMVPGLLVIPSISPLLELQEWRRQVQEFPILASFERARELSAWTPHAADVQRTSEWSSHGTASLQIRAMPQHQGDFPGASFGWPAANWSEYSEFRFEVSNPQPHDVALSMNIWDGEHHFGEFDPSDRFRRTVLIRGASTMTVQISVADISSAPAKRTMNMKDVAMVDLYLPDSPSGTVILVDNLRLE